MLSPLMSELFLNEYKSYSALKIALKWISEI